MASNPGNVLGLTLLSLDEGGITGLSSLYILREIMSRLQRKAGLQERPEPWEYFDLMAGTGTGAISAVMLGRLKMRMDDAINLYNRLVSDTFSENKSIILGSGTFKATKLEEGLRRIVMETTGNPDEMMMEEKPQEARCKVVIYAMFAHHLNASLPCAFRTYPASANVMPDCPIWKALRASTAHPELFKSVDIEELGMKHRFVGGAFGCSNPTAQLLKEAGALFPNRSVASVISIGAGHSRTIRVPQPGWLERVLPFGVFITSRVLRAAKGIATDNEQVANEMGFRFSNTSDVYYRLNVDQGINSIKAEEWGKQSMVVGFTRAYLQLPAINGMLDKLVTTIERRQATLATVQIDGRATVPSTSVSVGLKHCPRPSFMFKGRKLQLGKACRYFGNEAITQHVFVIHGLGGSGKTQTALKSAELMTGSFEGVLFIDGSSRDAIEAALSQFAVSENIGSQFMDTLKWFEHRRGRWMMLFDNVDDPGVRVHEYFPRHGRYDVLITTRHRAVARLARGEDSDCNIGEMDPEEGLELLLEAARLQKGSLQPSEYTAGINLLQEFGYLALAIVQCGAFICRSQCSIAQYYKMYLDERRATLEGDGVTPLMIEDYERSVFTTWTLNNTLVGTSSDRLWRLIVFLDRNGISEEIFRRAFENAQVYQPQIPPTDLEAEAQREVKDILGLFANGSGTWCSRLFLSAMGELVCPSLIDFDSVGNVYRLHPLVQQWARATASSPTSIENASFLLALSINRNKTAEDRAYRREIVSHVNEILDLCSTPNSNDAWQFIAVYDEINHLDKAGPLETYVMEARIRFLGNEHPDTLQSMRYVAGTHLGRGRLKEAEQMFIHVLATRRRMLGEDHPDTLESMANLAATYHYQGRLADAEALKVEVLAAQRRVLGGDHPDTLRNMANLAATHHNQGRLSEAESLFIEVLAARKRVFGADHPDTLQSMEDLANTYGRKGQLSDAESLQVEVLPARKRVLGKDHPDTLRSMAGLAATYSRQGRLTEAELLELEVLAARKQMLGDNHPTTLSSIANLAATYGQQGRLDEAESLEVEVLSIRRRVLGPDHLDTLRSMADLAATRCARGRLADAEAVLVEVLAARKRVRGEDHPDTLRSMSALGRVYNAQGRQTEYEAIMAEINAIEARR